MKTDYTGFLKKRGWIEEGVCRKCNSITLTKGVWRNDLGNNQQDWSCQKCNNLVSKLC